MTSSYSKKDKKRKENDQQEGDETLRSTFQVTKSWDRQTISRLPMHLVRL